MAFLLMGAGILLFGAGAALGLGGKRRVSCVESHSEEGLNYPWLDGVHGGLDHIEYEEPAGSGVWRRYTRQIWEAHCRAVSHDPATLVADHVRAFVNPRTRFARLMFHFLDGTMSEPSAYTYQLEAAWISRHGAY